MTSLEEKIRHSIDDATWIASSHAEDRLSERGLEAWQVGVASAAGKTVSVNPSAEPNPKVQIAGTLPDGTPIVAVWAWLRQANRAMLVTAYIEGAL